MSNFEEVTQKLAQDLLKIGAVKFGEFTFSSGSISPIYVDMRMTISHQEILKQVAQLFSSLVSDACYDLVCGVPLGAVPAATALSLKINKPLVMLRKERKAHGIKRLLEGVYQKGATCVLVEDVVTTGSSIIESLDKLEAEGVKVHDALVMVDYEQGAREKLEKRGVKLHALFTMKNLFAQLCQAGSVEQAMITKVQDYFDNPEQRFVPAKKCASFDQRSGQTKNKWSKKLYELMQRKKSNLVLAADVKTKQALFDLIESVGSELCVLKTHIDILEDFDASVPEKLKAYAQKYDFLIWEDRKFADIGTVVKAQYTDGVYKIADWADLITVHAIAGPGILDALGSVSQDKRPGCLLIAQMSSKGTLARGEYAKQTVKIALDYKDLVTGFICQEKLSDDPSFIHFTPGVKITKNTDQFGQQYLTPEKVITQQGTDVIIVGRGISQADDKALAAQQYRIAGWQAYEKRLSM